MKNLAQHWFSYSLIAVWLLFWLVELKFDLSSSMSCKGLNVIGSQYYRFVSALLLHKDFLHFLTNALAVYWVCVYLEAQVSPGKLMLFALLAGAGSNLVFSAIYQDSSSLGGSPLVFALIGLIVALQLRKPEIPRFQLGTWYGNWTLAYTVLANLPLLDASGSTVVIHTLALAIGGVTGFLCADLF